MRSIHQKLVKLVLGTLTEKGVVVHRCTKKEARLSHNSHTFDDFAEDASSVVCGSSRHFLIGYLYTSL